MVLTSRYKDRVARLGDERGLAGFLPRVVAVGTAFDLAATLGCGSFAGPAMKIFARRGQVRRGKMEGMDAAVIVDRDLAQRASDIENAIASVRLEGLEPSDEAKAIFQRYVDGELTADEMDSAIEQHLDREYGPVRLPQHQRS